MRPAPATPARARRPPSGSPQLQQGFGDARAYAQSIVARRLSPAPGNPGVRQAASGGLLAHCRQATKALVELGNAAAILQLGGAAGPGRVRLGIDFEHHEIALLAPGRAGFVGFAIGHLDLDGVILGVNSGLHCGMSFFGGWFRPACKQASAHSEASRNWQVCRIDAVAL